MPDPESLEKLERELVEIAGHKSTLSPKIREQLVSSIRQAKWTGSAMKPYIGTKIILAEPMERADAVMKGLVRDEHATIDPDGHSEPGYLVVYEDGYRSWSPKGTFDRAYRLISPGELALFVGRDLGRDP